MRLPAESAERPGPAPGADQGSEDVEIDKPAMFDTPEADAILEALEVFPPDNPWNLAVAAWPLHPKSKEIINSIGADKPLRYNRGHGLRAGAAGPEED